MAFISGVQVIDAPASALNNAGADPASSTENAVAVKSLRVNGKHYPYVSAQAYRHWLRRTLEAHGDWTVAPIFREAKVAYTDANPILYCDDDLLGYMRAEGTKKEAADTRAERVGETPMEKKKKKKVTVTRISPFRAGTFVGLSEGITRDFGTMSRHEGDPVPHEHQFYRTSLKGLFSLDLASAGVFSYEDRTGYKNLDAIRIRQAEEKGLHQDEASKAYRLDDTERIRRITMLLRSMPVITGGAKMALHYSDVSPVVVVVAVTKGGNNPYQYAVSGDREGKARIDLDVLQEIAEVWGDTLLSPLYIGWVRGYASENRQQFENNVASLSEHYPHGVVLDHPKCIFEQLADSLNENLNWLT